MTTNQPADVREAAHRVYVAALRRAYSEEANGGRETAEASFDLDLAQDEWAAALNNYAAARNDAEEAR
jgi:hypothetical protein